jgi:hypothetical protein
MITSEELKSYNIAVSAPISKSFAAKQERLLDSLKAGDFIWVSCWRGAEICRFIKIEKNPRTEGLLVVYLSEKEGLQRSYYYNVIRKARPDEIKHVINSLQKSLDFYNKPIKSLANLYEYLESYLRE